MIETGLSIDEWTERYAADLKENLETNIDSMTDLNADDQADLSRLNMTVIRQWLDEMVTNELQERRKKAT